MYILVSWWLIINLFTRDKWNMMTGVTTIYTIIHNIHKYTQFYVRSQYDRYNLSSSSSSRWNIAAPNANENTARNSTRSVLLWIVVMFTRILCTVGHMYTVWQQKAIIYNLHEPRFNCENLSSYAHMPTCAPRRPGCSIYHGRHIGITLWIPQYLPRGSSTWSRKTLQ